MPVTIQEKEAIRENVCMKYASGDRDTIKSAADDISSFIRRNFTEESVMDKILPPLPKDAMKTWTNPADPGQIYGIVEIEPDFPGAMSFSYNTPSPMVTMGMSVATFAMNRIMSYRQSVDIAQLRNYSVSLRDLCAEWAHRGILTQIDRRKFIAFNRTVGVLDTVNPATGAIQYKSVPGTLSPEAVSEITKIIPSIGPRNGLVAQTMLMNQITYRDFGKWLSAAYPEISTDIIKNGLGVFESGVYGLKIVVTIKRDFLPDGEVFLFTSPEWIGREYVYVEPQLMVSEHDFGISFYVATERGGGIFINKGVAKVKFTG